MSAVCARTPRIEHLEPERALPDFECAHVYEKIDGTNVLLFRYADARGERFVSYKTRLSPFLRVQPYGDFVALWTEIAAIYEAGVPIERYGYRVRTRAINIAFRRVRVMFSVPSSLWLTTWSPGHVKISLYAVDELPMVVVARLQAMWMSACGQGDAASGAGERT
jgi:hypothetical protein